MYVFYKPFQSIIRKYLLDDNTIYKKFEARMIVQNYNQIKLKCSCGRIKLVPVLILSYRGPRTCYECGFGAQISFARPRFRYQKDNQIGFTDDANFFGIEPIKVMMNSCSIVRIYRRGENFWELEELLY